MLVSVSSRPCQSREVGSKLTVRNFFQALRYLKLPCPQICLATALQKSIVVSHAKDSHTVQFSFRIAG